MEETQRQAAVQTKLREENQRLEERASTQARRCQRDRETQDELQAALKLMTAARGQLAQRLAEEESSRKELQKGSAELQAKLTATQQERAALGQQLQLEREVHQKEVDNMKAMMEDNKMKKDREVKDKLKLCSREHDEMAHLKVGSFYHCLFFFFGKKVYSERNSLNDTTCLYSKCVATSNWWLY